MLNKLKSALDGRKFCLVFAGLLMFAKVSSAVNSWVINYSGAIGDISFPDSLHGWGVSGINANHDGVVMFTNDGGKTWTEKILINAGALMSLDCIGFSGYLNGLVGGRYSKVVTGGAATGWYLISTGNGFNTFTTSGQYLESHYQYGGVAKIKSTSAGLIWSGYQGSSLTTGGTFLLAGHSMQLDDKPIPLVWCALDYSYMWMAYGLFYRTTTGAADLSPLYGFPTINDMDFVDILHGWAVGDSGKILYTDNGGTDSIWETLSSGVTNSLKCVKFVDSLNGWAGGQGIILRTRDGGNVWEVEATVPGVIRKICALDTIYAWALNTTYKGNSILKYDPLIGVEEQATGNSQEATLQIIKDKISLSVPNLSEAKSALGGLKANITIYDLGGREKEVVYSGTLSKGDYTFTPSIKKSGVYFVRLSAGNYKETKKLVLIK